jgi:hypothetical protein
MRTISLHLPDSLDERARELAHKENSGQPSIRSVGHL